MALSVSHDYSLLRHNTFGMDVKACTFVEYESVEELRAILPELPRPLLHIGQGSNLLFCGDYTGTVLHSRITDFAVISESEVDVLVRAGSGIVWDEFVSRCLENGLFGAENLSGIPGETGASAVQNIGAYGVEACELIESVEVLDSETLELFSFAGSECGYAYRDSIFKKPENKKYIVTHVTYRMRRRWKPVLDYKALAQCFEGRPAPTAEDVRNAVVSMRNSKLPDPVVLGNAGSFFTNPIVTEKTAAALLAEYQDMPHYHAAGGMVKLSAAWLIDRSGWKGRSLGRAGVYGKQPLVLVNLGGASAEDILSLRDAVVADVFNRFGVSLDMEVNKIC